MMIEDIYYTVEKIGKGKGVIKKSTFLGFCIPVDSVDNAEDLVKQYKKEYYDARHVCYAYQIGVETKESRANDNGEPSGTAGRPILGVIASHDLTNVLIIVVRYFGGIKLGTSGLIDAYRSVAELALLDAHITQQTLEQTFSFDFPYSSMNEVMKLIKKFGVKIVSNDVDNVCRIRVSGPSSITDQFKTGLKDLMVKSRR